VARSIRYRGRANLRKQEEPAPRLGRTDEMRGPPRVTALRKKRSCVMRQKRKKVEAFVPVGKTRVRVRLPVRRGNKLQKSAGGDWPRIRSYAALQKEWRYE